MLFPIKGLHSVHIVANNKKETSILMRRQKKAQYRDGDTLRAFQHHFLCGAGGQVSKGRSEYAGRDGRVVACAPTPRRACLSEALSGSEASSAGLSASSPSVSGGGAQFPLAMIANEDCISDKDGEDAADAFSFPFTRPEGTDLPLPMSDEPPVRHVSPSVENAVPMGQGVNEEDASRKCPWRNRGVVAPSAAAKAIALPRRHIEPCDPSEWLSTVRDVRIAGANALFSEDHEEDEPLIALLKALSTPRPSSGVGGGAGLRRLCLDRCRGLRRFPVPLTHFPALTELALVDCPDFKGFAGPACDPPMSGLASRDDDTVMHALPLEHLRIVGCRRFASFKGLSNQFSCHPPVSKMEAAALLVGPFLTAPKETAMMVSPVFPRLATITVLHSDSLFSLHGLEGCARLEELELTWCPALATFEGLPQPLPHSLRRIDAAHSPQIASLAMFLGGEEDDGIHESPPRKEHNERTHLTGMVTTVAPPQRGVLTLFLSPWCEARTYDGGTIARLLRRSKRHRRPWTTACTMMISSTRDDNNEPVPQGVVSCPLSTPLPDIHIVWDDH